jgi:N-methylhydantoinase A
VSVERGRDVRDFAMLAFGGNGPLFAAGIAVELGIGRVIVPPMPGLFSAFGLLLADTEHHASRSLRMHQSDAALLQATLDELQQEAASQLMAEGFPTERQQIALSARARYVGQSSEIAVKLNSADAVAILAELPEAFATEHERTYGFRAPPEEPVELMGIALVARGVPERPRLPARIPPAAMSVPSSRRAWFASTGWTEVPVTDRAGLAGETRAGPLIVQEYDATCLVPPGATATLDDFGNIRIALG